MTSRLIISFIGSVDLNCLGIVVDRPTRPGDMSPVVRLLCHLAQKKLCPPRSTRLMLFDDRPETGERRQFKEVLAAQLPGLGLGGLRLDLKPLALPGGPTDLHALYESVWANIPTTGPDAADEVLFHISSGTPAMQATLLLASNCLPLKCARLFETSTRGAEEKILPYRLAAQAVNRRIETGPPPRLAKDAFRELLPNTVIDDVLVQATYAALYRAASRSRRADGPDLLLSGPAGSGKLHAAKQFARWRRQGVVTCLSAADLDLDGAFPQRASVIIPHLDDWPADSLVRLQTWRAARPDLAVVATWRTDRLSSAPLSEVARVGLTNASHLALPALSTRSDISRVGEAVAHEAGIWSAKVRQRLDYELKTQVYPQGLHDLRRVLSEAALHSESEHPGQDGHSRARAINDAVRDQDTLRRVLEGIGALRFDPSAGAGLLETLEVVKSLLVRITVARYGTQHESARVLGMSSQWVQKTLRGNAMQLPAWVEQLGPHSASGSDE